MSENKTIYSREEFETLRLEMAGRMAKDRQLQKDSLDVLVRADQYHWIHQTTWFGEPVLQLPQDMFAFQEIIWRTRPDFIVELGVAWGGSMLFNATVCEALSHGQVIGVDIFMPNDLLKRLKSKGSISKRLHFVTGSSVDAATAKQVKNLLGGSTRTFIIFDSYHTKGHVLQELELYSPFVGKGCYLLCGDTIVHRIPPQVHRKREWGPENNPMLALEEFLSKQKRFVIDEFFDKKLLMTCNPRGYLRAVAEPAADGP